MCSAWHLEDFCGVGVVFVFFKLSPGIIRKTPLLCYLCWSCCCSTVESVIVHMWAGCYLCDCSCWKIHTESCFFSGKEKLSLSSLVVFMTKLSWLCSLFPSTLTYIALLSCLLCAGAWKELSCQPLCYRAGQTVPVSSLQPGFLGWPGRQRSCLYIIVTCLSVKWVMRTAIT